MHVQSSLCRKLILCAAIPILTPFLQAVDIHIDQSIQDELPVHYPKQIDDHTQLVLDEDINLTGAGNISFSSDDMLLFTGQSYSFTLNNGGITAKFIELYELRALSFSSSTAIEGMNGILEVSSIDPSETLNPYSLQSTVSLGYITEGITFNNNGTADGSKPNAALWAWAELNQATESGVTTSESQVNLFSAESLEFSDNFWGSGAINSYAKGVEYGYAEVRISDINTVIFQRNHSGGSLISAQGSGGYSESNIQLSGNALTMKDNVSGDSLMKAYAIGGTDNNAYAYINLSFNESILLSGNTSGGNGGVASALSVIDPGNNSEGRARISIEAARQTIIENNTSAANGGAFSSVTRANDGYSGEVKNNTNIAFSIFGNLASDFVIQNNHAEGKGGAVYVSGGTVQIEAFTNDTDIVANVIFRGNTMGNKATGDLIANSLYVEASNGYQAGISDLRAQEGNSIIFEGSVISKPAVIEDSDGPFMHINRPDAIPTRSEHLPNVYKGTVLFTGQSVAGTIGPKQAWESDEHYQSRIDQSRTSRIDQDVILHNGTLAVQHKAELIIKSLTVDSLARQEMEDESGNFDGARLNTNFSGLIHVQGNVDLAGLADIDISGFLGGTSSTAQSSPIWMQIDTGSLSGIIEIMNLGDLYAQGLLEDTMVFNILTLNIVDSHIPDTTELHTSAERFNQGLGIADPDEEWQLVWVENFAGTDTRSLILHKNGMPIPEPTSALLALLGFASLVTRRRVRKD